MAIDPWIYVERTHIEVEDVDPQSPGLLRIRVDLNRKPEPEWTEFFEASAGPPVPASMQPPRVADDTIRLRTPDAEVEEHVEHLDRRITAANEHYATQVLPLRWAEQEERDRQAVEQQRRLEDAQRRIDQARQRLDEAQRRVDAM